MGSTNQSPEFLKAQKEYFFCKTDEEKLLALKEMMKYMPKHKAGEGIRKNIRMRYKKLQGKLSKLKKKKKNKQNVRKEGTQIILCGLTNSGKSSLLSALTNAKPEIAPYEFTTKQSNIGILNYKGIKFQIIDPPAINHEDFDQGLANTADILLLIIIKINQLEEILPFLEKSLGEKIIVFNKSDLLSQEEKRKISETLKTKKYNFCLISTKTGEGIDSLSNLLIEKSGVIRIYTKEPGKQKSPEPVIMKPESTVEDLSKKVFHSSIRIKEARVTGPSSKFPNQKVGLKHQLKDKDVVEFHIS